MKYIRHYITFGFIRMLVEIDGTTYEFLRNVTVSPSFIKHPRSMIWFNYGHGDVTDEVNEKLNEMYEANKI